MKRKWASAEQKRQHELLTQQWESLKRKHETTKTVTSNQKPKTLSDQFATNLAYRTRGNKHIPSIQGGEIHTFKAEEKRYTGSKMKGISTMHKSNATPVFSDDEIKDHANMRR